MMSKIQKSTTKTPERYLTVYGKKPRGSKAAKRYSYKDLDLFLYYAKAETRGNVQIYHDRLPYPLIKVITTPLDGSIDGAYSWVAKNYDEIKERLKTVDNLINIPRDVVRGFFNG